MGDWAEGKLGDVLTVKYGKDHKTLGEGKIPVLGSGGIMRYADKYLYDKKSILIPRKGSLNNIMYRDEPFWTVDTMFWTIVNEDKVAPKYLFYQLTQIDFNNLNVGSAVPSLTVPVINEIDVTLPPLTEQKAIASVLSSLDDKIDLLHRQNQTLEAMAEALFKEWFVVNAKEEWEEKKLGQLVSVKRGGSPRPIHDYLSDVGLNWLKISDVTSLKTPFIFSIKEKIKIEGLSKTTFLKSGALILSNSATPGIPKILQVDSCIHDGWLHFPVSKFSNEFLYLLFLHIRPELINLGNGSIFTNLKTDILKDFVLKVPDDSALKHFDNIIKPVFKKMLMNTENINTLIALRDTLLPKLMSGEIRVEKLNLIIDQYA